MKYKNYIPVKRHWFDMFTRHFQEQYWVPEAKVFISIIKINEDLFSYQDSPEKTQ